MYRVLQAGKQSVLCTGCCRQASNPSYAQGAAGRQAIRLMHRVLQAGKQPASSWLLRLPLGLMQAGLGQSMQMETLHQLLWKCYPSS